MLAQLNKQDLMDYVVLRVENLAITSPHALLVLVVDR